MKGAKGLIVCDLDGTLLQDDKQLSSYTQQTLLRAKEAGYRLCFASGRCEQMMSVYSDAVHQCDYIVSCNGALAKYMPGQTVIYESVIGVGCVRRILEYLIGHHMEFMMYSSSHMYYTDNSQALLKRIRDYELLCEKKGVPVKLPASPVYTDRPLPDYEGIIKVVAYEDDSRKLDAYYKFIDGEVEGIHCESTGYGLMGTFCENVSKRDAIESVKRHAELTSADVYVFGDYDNDLSMFECADNRIAMENAVDLLKKRATFVTKSNNKDGVAWYLEEMLKI